LREEASLDGDVAIFSECGAYRYLLTRGEAEGQTLGVVMLNPSTANAFKDDPTIRRVRKFGAAWGYKRILIGNLFALRSPHPRDLFGVDDPVGPQNDKFLARILNSSATTLVAWGRNALAPARARSVVGFAHAHRIELVCLGTTKDGSPIHPLARGKHRVPDDAKPRPWRMP
jgi:hypothetical protein